MTLSALTIATYSKKIVTMRTCSVLNIIASIIWIGVALGDDVRRIPADFLLGSATSAYQYEGAWDEDGKGPTLWDVSVRSRNFTNGSNADIAADGYHKYKEDIRLMKDMGLDFFRFSISWSRILPTGSAHNINRKGIEFYNNFIDELLRYNITPMVTTFQIDIPAKLQEYGAWTNPAMVDFYLDYVKVLFDNFGDRVKLWITFNEPVVYCIYTYRSGNTFPPFTDLSGIGDYMCIKNSLLAHARAYHLYNEHYKPKYNGKVGFSIYNNWYEPLTNSTDDRIATDEATEFMGGMFLNPIFSKAGDYPEFVKRRVAAKSAEQGFPRSRLPALTSDEINLIKGSTDFLGLNVYTTTKVYRNSSVDGMFPVPSVADDLHIGIETDILTLGPILSDPVGAYKSLMLIKEKYNNPLVYITENGYSDGALKDHMRIEFINDYLNAILDAREDGCDVRGYAVWSFMDTFEWAGGYDAKKFGLFEVDFASPNLTRTPRLSAYYYRELTANRTLTRKYIY